MNTPRDFRAPQDGEPGVARDPDELSDDQLELVMGGLARPWIEGMSAAVPRRATDGSSDAASALVA
jgi:hypothetical protein